MTEYFQLSDSNGNPLGMATREECHGNPALIHLVVHLHVFDPDGRLFLQRRALSKDTNPGKWDTSVGGHVNAGEAIEHAMLREAKEELGIDAAGAKKLFGYLYRSGSFETEFAWCYRIVYRGEIHADPVEIMDGRFFSASEIDSMAGTGSLTPMFEHELPKLRAALRSAH